jgi:hypothetical protein
MGVLYVPENIKKESSRKNHQTQPIAWKKRTSEKNLDGPGMSGKKPFENRIQWDHKRAKNRSCTP